MDEAHRGWAWVLDGSSSVLIVTHLFQSRFVRLLDSFLQFAQSLNEAVHGRCDLERPYVISLLLSH